MEVKPGYTQTDVGVFPDEWNICSLGSLCDVRDGTHESPRFFKQGVPFVTSKNIVDGQLDLENVSYISERDAAEFDKRSKVDLHDILMSMIGTIGSAVLVECEPNFCIKNVALLKPQNVDPPFLIQLINSPIFQRYLADNLDGGIQKFISLGTLRQLRVAMPDETEQRAIATALSDVDALLGALDRLIAKKRDLKQAAMQQLLTGQTRLPGFHGDWEVKILGDLFTFSGGYSASRDQLSTEGHCYLHYGDIHGSTKACVDARADYQDIPKLDIPLKRVSSNSLLKDGDVVFVDASEDDEGTSRHVVVVNKDNVPFISGLHTIAAKSKTDELAHEYRRYCFQTTAIRQQFLFYAVGTKVSGISKTNIPKLTLPVPSVPEQTAIAAVLRDMDAELALLTQRLEKTRALKQGMMQELLTGRTRLI